MAFLGVPRYTKDLDLWVDPREVGRLLGAITHFFGGDNPGVARSSRARPGVVQLGYEPNWVDLVLLEGHDFDAAYARSQEYTVQGVAVRVVAKEDFIRLKRTFGRSLDLRDIEGLEGEAPN